jgi:flavin reductase (DIM6/NTAB) family NADH-FMN oxidoreductase RutF
MKYNYDEIMGLEKRFRANFINSLGGFKSLVLVGTKSREGLENLATFSSLFHLGANPPLCGIVIRPNEEKQNTLGNIVSTKQYTINHVMPVFYRPAHQCSAKYGEGVSEFAAVGLTPEYTAGIGAPFVRESSVKFACELVQKIDMELNGTFIVIGKIIHVSVPPEVVQQDGFIDIEQAGTMTCSGLDSYHTTKRLARLHYAQVGEAVRDLRWGEDGPAYGPG